MASDNERVPLAAIFRVFFMVGATSFGGGLTSSIHRETVIQRKWLTNEQFLAGMALGQVLPGGNVSNIAVYVGQTLRGAAGAAIAPCAILTAPFFFCIGMAVVYDDATRIPGFHAAMDGVAAAAIGMMLRMGFMGARHSCARPAPILIAVAVFFGVGVEQWPLLPVLAVAAPLSLWSAWRRTAPKDAAEDA
jgi:chromate transporter